LGVGRVRTGIVCYGNIYYVHDFYNANAKLTTYMTRASLPIRYQITNEGTASKTSRMKMICATAISEGGFEQLGNPYSSGLDSTVSITTTVYPILGIRLIDDEISKRTAAKIIGAQIVSTSGANVAYYIYHYLAPTDSDVSFCPIIGGTWTTVPSGSVIEINKSGTSLDVTTVIPRPIFQGYFSNNADFTSQTLDRSIQLTCDIDGNVDYIVLAAKTLNSTDDIAGSIQWTEYPT